MSAAEKRVKIGVAGEVALAGSLMVRRRSYFSSDWLGAVRELSDLVGGIETERAGRPRFDPRHRALVLASVQASVAFLEAMVNELYQDAHDGHGLGGDGYLAPLAPDVHERMAALWRETGQGKRLETLAKYQLLLLLAAKQPLEVGAPPHQDARLLVQLRNVLVHYQPESISATDRHRFEARYRQKFPDNRLMTGSGSPWWPHHCLGHGLTEWAHHGRVPSSGVRG